MCWSPDEDTRSEYDVVADMQKLFAGDVVLLNELVIELLELADDEYLEEDTVEMAIDAIRRVNTPVNKPQAVAA